MTRRRIPVPPAPSDLAPELAPDEPHAPLLLRAAEQVADAGGDGPTLLGFSFVEGGVDVAATLVPDDPRCVAAGLFGFTAPPHWAAAALVCGGSARHLDDDPGPGDRDAVAVVVVDRNGAVASSVRMDDGDPYDPGPPSGLLVDALHRVLGLDTPGPALPPAALVLSVWVERLVTLAVDGEQVPTWPEAVLVHPGVPGHGDVAASVETVAHASTEVLRGTTWSALRDHCVAGARLAADLSRTEARWMDDAMFARWLLAAGPDLRPACALLRVLGAVEVADGVEQVAEILGVDLWPGELPATST